MIRVNFCDFWPGFEQNNLFMKFLERHFPVKIDVNPDYLFFSVYGSKHLKYEKGIKILFTGENLVPDFNLCDYAMGFHYLEFEDRYLRFPLYIYYQWYYNLIDTEHINLAKTLGNEALLQRKFCNFIYSNNLNADPIRDLFFHQLSKYRKVDSGGRHLNNIGGPVKNKMEFIKNYKFTIAFENSSVPGYTTEKLIEPILMRSLPVYYGNPLVHMDFLPGTFINFKNQSIEEVISEIIRLDQDDDQYLTVLKRSKFQPDNSLDNWEKKLIEFFETVFSQPIALASRRASYGFNHHYLTNMKLQSHLLAGKMRANALKSGVKDLIKKTIPNRSNR